MLDMSRMDGHTCEVSDNMVVAGVPTPYCRFASGPAGRGTRFVSMTVSEPFPIAFCQWSRGSFPLPLYMCSNWIKVDTRCVVRKVNSLGFNFVATSICCDG
jgi:hypothetical protein